MKKKIEATPSKDPMLLEFNEIAELNDIRDSLKAIHNLQLAFVPIARDLATRQRKWWDKALGDRGLSLEDGGYKVAGNKIIPDLQNEED